METYKERLLHAMGLRTPPWAQAELARAIGCTKATVNQAVGTGTGSMSALNTARAARALNVDAHWLATGEGEARPYGQMERLALSPKAVYIGSRLDAISDPRRRARTYALIVSMLDFDGELQPGILPPE